MPGDAWIVGDQPPIIASALKKGLFFPLYSPPTSKSIRTLYILTLSPLTDQFLHLSLHKPRKTLEIP